MGGIRCGAWAPVNWRLLVLLTGMVASAQAAALEADALFAKVVPSVWTVVATDAQGRNSTQGSAVVIGPGRLVTNCHVLARMTRFQVTKDNVSYGAKLEFPDPENDLCQIRVDNFHAPAVELADMGALRVGTRVYAIGTPRGLETTLSDGLLSGLRRDDSGQLMFVQTTAPISAGSSGGGLFDAEGRLIGITTFIRRESQNINLAVPANRVAELPERGRALLEQRAASRAPISPSVAPAEAMELTAQRQPGDWFEYVITENITQLRSTVNLQVDRVEGDRVVFNRGARVEGLAGQVLESTSSALVELDALTPPGGWAPNGRVLSGVHPIKFSTTLQGFPASFDLTAVASAEQPIRVGAGEYNAVRIDLQGWHTRVSPSRMSTPTMPYQATVWYVPTLNRVVRFSVEFRTSNKVIWVHEAMELARAGRR
jgi:serine protease Do